MTQSPKNKIMTVNRDIEKIKESLYLVEISFKGMTRSLRLDWCDLGFQGEKLLRIKESKFRLKGVPIFKHLALKLKQLTALKVEWEHNRTIIVDGQRLVTQSQFNACLEDIANMKQLADQFRAELIEEREEGLELIKEKVTKLLTEFDVDPNDINTKLLTIERDFPTDEEINNLIIVESRYIRVKGLIEQLEEQIEEEEILNKQLEAKALQELRVSKEQQIKSLMKLKDRVFKEAEKIVLQILSEQIERCQKVEVGDNNKHLRNRIEKHLAKIEALLDLDLSGNFEQAKLNLEQLELFLVNNAGANPDLRKKLEAQFSELQKQLESSYNDILKVERTTTKVKTCKLLVA